MALDHHIVSSNMNRESVIHTEFNMGGVSRERYGMIDDEYTMGGTNLRQMLLNSEYAIGTSKTREGYMYDQQPISTNPTREGLISGEYSIGTAKIRQLYFNESYSIGMIDPRQAATDIDYSLATMEWRSALLNDEYSISSAKYRNGVAEIGYTLGSSWARGSAMDIEFNAGMRQAWESTLINNASEAIRVDGYGSVQDEISLATTVMKFANLDDMKTAHSIMRKGQFNVEILSDNMNRLSLMLEENHSTRILKEASVHEMESEVVKLRLSELHGEGWYGGKGFRDTDLVELIYDSIKSTKNSALDRDVILAYKHTHDAYLHETTDSTIEKIANLEEQLLADKPQYGYMDLTLLLGGTNLKYADVPVESMGGTGLSYGDIPVEIVGGTNLKYGDVPIEIVGGTNLKYGTTEIVLSADKPQYGNMEENLLADKPQYGYLEENMYGLKNAKDSIIDEQIHAFKDGKEVDLIQTLEFDKEDRSAFLHDNLFAVKAERWAHSHETINDVVKLRNGTLEQSMFYGNKGLKESIMGMEWVGFQYKQLDLIQSEYAYLKTRDVHIEDESYMSSRSSYEAYNHQLDSGMNLLRSTTLDWEQLAAEKMDRQGHSHEMESGVRGERSGDHFDGYMGPHFRGVLSQVKS